MAGSVISTNYVSLVTQNYLSKSYGALGKAIERLSSGYRINSAMDDAAGQAIAARFTAQINGLAQASRNANDGISIAQTTEGAVNETNNSVQRIRELVVQGLNGSNSQSDLQSLQDEIFQRLQEINRVSDQTQFNGVYVLKTGASLVVQVGFNDGERISINLRELTAKTLGLQDFTIAGPKSAPAAAVQADMDKAFGATSGVTTVASAEAVANTLQTRLGLAAGVTVAAAPEVEATTGTWFVRVGINPADAAAVAALKTRGFEGVVGTNKDYFIAVNPKEATIATNTATFTLDTASMSLTRLNVLATANPLQKLDLALQKVSEIRSELGATMSRFESTVATLDNTVTNLSAARSRIQDADYAVEVSNMTKAQILQQAGTSALAQANQVPQLVLALLR